MLVFVTCSMFIIAYSVPAGTFLAAQPEDNWVAHPMYISQLVSPLAFSGYTPSDIRTAYNLPSSGGNGTTIAIIDAYDAPTITSDLAVFSSLYNLPAPNASNFEIKKMQSVINVNSSWTLETCLDVEWAHAIAPDAKILLVEAVSESDYDLLSAVDYATNQTGVVAVSMSWGGPEDGTIHDSHFNKPGITFFASSGDDGAGVMWPAVSANVVAVGGTTLNQNSDGTFSETAWNGSGGGVSSFVAMPAYQTSFGLNYSKRAVPDVSYDADLATGVRVCRNNNWYLVGGTSAGAPQWAAIYALGLSATNTNLYGKAKSAYSSHFRDITSGSNGGYNATTGYDLVTGLGSPLTTNFGTEVTVSPTSGPPNGSITLNGVGFTSGGSVNISYRNPINSSWVPLINNLPLTSSNFSYPLNATDLLQNNTAGDSQPQFDKIFFSVIDNGNGHSYNTTVPYTEWRRGLAQVGNLTASGLYGNNTDLSAKLFVQKGDLMPVVGNWFSPGNVSLLWDNVTSLGTFSTDSNGFFSATMQVPITTVGPHLLTINDGASNFCVNLTSLPSIANNYTNGWHTSNFTINLTPDDAVNETFYRINGGQVFNVTANGLPTISTEGSSNTLEYWSTWNVYGTGTTDLPHVTINGIELNKTPPAGTITTSPTTSTTAITLALSATDAISGVAQMRFSNDNTVWSNWEPYATSKTWTLQSGDGQKTVTVQFMDNAGLTSTYSYTLTLQTPQPSPTATPTPTPSPTPAPTPTASPSPTPSIEPLVPEIPAIAAILIVLTASILVTALTRRRK